MIVFYANFKGNFKKQFAYRLPVISTSVSSIISVLAQIALWVYIYKNDPEQSSYMMGYVVISLLLACLHDSDIAKSIEKRVRSGDLAIDMIRPVNMSIIFWSEALGNAAARLVLRGLPILFLFRFVFFRVHVSILDFTLFLCAALIGCVLYNALYMAIGYLAFVVTMNWPYIRIANDTLRLLSGSIVPIALFPSLLQGISWCFPFRLLYAFPIDLLIGNLDRQEIVIGFLVLLVWTIVLCAVLQITIQNVEKHLTIQGG